MRVMLLTAALLHAPFALAQESTPAPDSGTPVEAPAPAQDSGTPTPAPAAATAEKKADWGWAFLAAMEFGGDTVATVTFTDGSDQDVDAGQGVTLGVGARYRPYVDAPWGVRSTLGYKFVTTQASNANIGLDRMVWDLIANYRVTEEVWLGGGVVRHMNTSFNGDGFAPDVDFEDAMGLRLEAGWKWVALIYTGMEYEDEFGFTYDASSIGLVITNAF